MRLREPYLNAAVLLGLIALPLAALLADAPFTITLVQCDRKWRIC